MAPCFLATAIVILRGGCQTGHGRSPLSKERLLIVLLTSSRPSRKSFVLQLRKSAHSMGTF